MVSARFFRQARWRSLLLQPTWIAGAISVGFHGVLFAAGPTFSNFDLDTLADPDALAANRRVPLVELTPEEQQRHLPDFSNSFYSLSSLDDFETTALPPTLVPSVPAATTTTTTPRRGPHPRTTVTTPSIPLRTTPGPLPTGGTTELNSPGAEATPDETTASTPSEDATSTAAQSTTSDASTTEPSAQDLAIAPNNPAEGSAGNASGQRPAAEPPQTFAYNSDTLEEAWGRWLDQTDPSLQGQPLPAERFPLTYVPRQDACPNIDQDGLVAVLVNAEGKLLEGSVKLLQSTGSEALDNWAQTDGLNTWLGESKFPEDSQPQTAYLLEVFVAQAEICN